MFGGILDPRHVFRGSVLVHPASKRTRFRLGFTKEDDLPMPEDSTNKTSKGRHHVGFAWLVGPKLNDHTPGPKEIHLVVYAPHTKDRFDSAEERVLSEYPGAQVLRAGNVRMWFDETTDYQRRLKLCWLMTIDTNARQVRLLTHFAKSLGIEDPLKRQFEGRCRVQMLHPGRIIYVPLEFEADPKSDLESNPPRADAAKEST